MQITDTVQCKKLLQVTSTQKTQNKLGRNEAFKEIMTNVTVPEMDKA